MKKVKKLNKNSKVTTNSVRAYACYTRCQCEIDCGGGSSVGMHGATIGSTTVRA